MALGNPPTVVRQGRGSLDALGLEMA